MFSVSFTSVQPWLYKTWFTEDIKRFHNRCLHIWTVLFFLYFFPWLYLWSYPPPPPCYHFPSFAFNSKHLERRLFDTKGMQRSQMNPVAAESVRRQLWWLNLLPASSWAKACGDSVFPPKSTGAAKPSESKLRHESDQNQSSDNEQD